MSRERQEREVTVTRLMSVDIITCDKCRAEAMIDGGVAVGWIILCAATHEESGESAQHFCPTCAPGVRKVVLLAPALVGP